MNSDHYAHTCEDTSAGHSQKAAEYHETYLALKARRKAEEQTATRIGYTRMTAVAAFLCLCAMMANCAKG